jgi:hypothetical protein
MNPFTQNNPYPFHSLTKLSVFCSGVYWKVTKFILKINKIAMCKNSTSLKFQSFEILNV